MQHKKKSPRTRKLVITGMLAAISIVLGLTPIGFIPIGYTKLTIMHLPVILAALLEGPIVGMIVGLVFGLFSLYQALVMPTSPVSALFLNPMVSVLPRLLIGPCTFWVYHLAQKLSKGRKVLPVVLAALAGSLTNTLGVLSMLWLLYAARYAQLLGLAPVAGTVAIWGLALTNGLPEAVLAALIVVPTERALRKVVHRKGKKDA